MPPGSLVANVPCLAGLAIALSAMPAAAQAPSAVRPLVQPLPNDDSQTLNAALARLAQNPHDAAALIDAGTAALALGDADAAVGFFTRADQVSPGNPQAKAGLAAASVRNEDPFTAIRLFGEAEKAGPLSSDRLADRGLAYDLVGDNLTAQRYYRLAGPTNDEALRRLSLSLAIAGDRRGSEAALSPLLTRSDKSAWRVRAFALAILGDTAQAVSIANATMPAGLAAGIAPYLRYMGQLTPAQQAAAANLGHFPRASEIGRDDPRIAQYSRPVARPAATGPDAGLIPRGEPLGRKESQRQAKQERNRERNRERQASRERERPPEPVVATIVNPPPAPITAAPVPKPVPVPVASPPPPTAAMTALAATQRAQTPVRPPDAVPLAVAAPAAPAAPATTPPPAPGPSFELVPANPQPVSRPVVVSALPPPALPPSAPVSAAKSAAPSLADAFSEFAHPTISTAPAPGAVDLRRIAAARPAPKEVKPEAPPQPSRIWVQVATGRDKRALAFDWRKMSRENASNFRRRSPFVASWGQTNRLLTGPFETEAAATAFVNQLRKEDIANAFLWTSPAGQVVDELALGK